MAGAAYSFLPGYQLSARLFQSLVIDVHAAGFESNRVFLGKMLERGVCELFGNFRPQSVWGQLFRPHETIGIKVNCLAGKRGSTHPMLVEAIVEQLMKSGIPSERIVIWDRHDDDLLSAGFALNYDNNNYPKCFGNNYCGYSENLFINGAIGSRLSRILTEICDAIINVPVIKDHSITGVSGALKNYFGGIHNPNKYHLNGGDPYIADLYEIEQIRRKTRLTICDGLTIQYHGGPSYRPQWSAPGNRLLFAVDAVALDIILLKLIDQFRSNNGLNALKEDNRFPQYLLTAHRKGIGQADQNRIVHKIVKI